MHECQICGQACDCDGEDTWFENVANCAHECEDFEDDDCDPVDADLDTVEYDIWD